MALISELISRQRGQKVVQHLRGDVLEIGCSIGGLYGACRDRIASYTGLDIEARHLERARRSYPEADFRLCNIEHDEIGIEGAIDTLVMLALIEHIANQGHLLKQAHKALRPGGRMVLTTPTPFGNDLVHPIASRIGLLNPGVAEEHLVIYNRTRLKAVAAKHGFEVESYETFQLWCNQLAILRKPA